MSCNDADIVYGKNISERQKHVTLLAACFFGAEMGMKKDIICPSCKKKIGTYDGRSTVNPIILNCRNCWVQVLYDIKTDKRTIKSLPQRTTASGVTFR